MNKSIIGEKITNEILGRFLYNHRKEPFSRLFIFKDTLEGEVFWRQQNQLYSTLEDFGKSNPKGYNEIVSRLLSQVSTMPIQELRKNDYWQHFGNLFSQIKEIANNDQH
jgi:hypothetical protein